MQAVHKLSNAEGVGVRQPQRYKVVHMGVKRQKSFRRGGLRKYTNMRYVLLDGRIAEKRIFKFIRSLYTSRTEVRLSAKNLPFHGVICLEASYMQAEEFGPIFVIFLGATCNEAWKYNTVAASCAN